FLMVLLNQAIKQHRALPESRRQRHYNVEVALDRLEVLTKLCLRAIECHLAQIQVQRFPDGGPSHQPHNARPGRDRKAEIPRGPAPDLRVMDLRTEESADEPGTLGPVELTQKRCIQAPFLVHPDL